MAADVGRRRRRGLRIPTDAARQRASTIYRFEEYELDTALLELRRGRTTVHVEPQVFALLAHLIEHRDRVIPKNELLDELWGSRYVNESTLTSRIKAARKAVADDGTEQRVIRTAHGRGYLLSCYEAHLTRRPRLAGELARWLQQAGHRVEPPSSVDEPYRLELAGDWHAAADAWADRGMPYDRDLSARVRSRRRGQMSMPIGSWSRSQPRWAIAWRQAKRSVIPAT